MPFYISIPLVLTNTQHNQLEQNFVVHNNFYGWYIIILKAILNSVQRVILLYWEAINRWQKRMNLSTWRSKTLSRPKLSKSAYPSEILNAWSPPLQKALLPYKGQFRYNSSCMRNIIKICTLLKNWNVDIWCFSNRYNTDSRQSVC